MSNAAKPIMNLTMANSCLLSLSSLVSSNNTVSYQSVAFKPIKLQLSYGSPNTSILLPCLSLGRKTRSSSIHFVAKTSDWAPQEKETEGEGYTDEDEGGEGGEGGIFYDDDDEFGETPEGVLEDVGDGEDAEPFEGGLEDGHQVEPGDGGNFEPSEEAKLFVGNLPYDVDGPQLAELFEQAGTVEIAEIIYNMDTDQSRGFGFVTMSSAEEAAKAIEKFHRYDLGGRLLNVNKAAQAGTKPERAWHKPSFRVYVGNLPWDVDNACLEQIFSEHGKVESAKVVYNYDTGRSRGFGFVDLANETEMNDAISALDGQSLDGRVIRVSVAEQRPRRTAF